MSEALVEIRFASTLYSARALQAAAEAFADFARIDIPAAAAEGYYHVALAPGDDVDPAELRGAFANFVLARTLAR